MSLYKNIYHICTIGYRDGSKICMIIIFGYNGFFRIVIIYNLAEVSLSIITYNLRRQQILR